MTNKTTSTATLANGCFWCTEAIFQRLKGVKKVTSGYTGGEKENPSYEQVSTGTTGHAEAIQIEFDQQIISYETILQIFFATHDPTTLNQQGADHGTQYRSAIFYHDNRQKEVAQASIKRLENEKKYPRPVVTQVVPYTKFYAAEEYHLNYYNDKPYAPYCTLIIDPKVKKLLQEFKKEVKEEYLT